jgi:exodeoxyribonuclease-3
VKIASWNVNSLRVRLDHVLTWVGSAAPDVLALQETKLRDEDFPVDTFSALGYHAAFSGQPTYNGVAILSKQPASELSAEIEGFEDSQRRVLGANICGLRILNLYVPNGQTVSSEKYRYKLAWLDALTRQLRNDLRRYDHCVVLGDYNIAPEDRDVHDPKAWAGKVLCSEPERKALNNILALGFRDTFRLFPQHEKSFSWWDYRAAGFRRNRGLRIDLVLASDSLSAYCGAASIDVEPRRWERPSDHAPVIAEFDLD